MKTQELRIGNLLHASFEDEDGKEQNTICKVLAIDINGHLGDGFDFMFESIDGNDNEIYDDCFGIPLTEEWLLKFGFEYIGICDDFPKGYYKHKALLEICFDNTFEPAVTGNDWGATYIMVPEMKYVHQLQNLFYALTGEELTIKNP